MRVASSEAFQKSILVLTSLGTKNNTGQAEGLPCIVFPTYLGNIVADMNTSTTTMLSNQYPKLVWDKIPDTIANKGGFPKYHRAGPEEFFSFLAKKLVEETEELINAKDRADILVEMADVYEVLETLRNLHGIDSNVLSTILSSRRKIKGGFESKIIMESISWNLLHRKLLLTEKFFNIQLYNCTPDTAPNQKFQANSKCLSLERWFVHILNFREPQAKQNVVRQPIRERHSCKE